MKIVICGSIDFYDEMILARKKLENMGHQIKMPPSSIKNNKRENIAIKDYMKLRRNCKNNRSWIWKRKNELIKNYFPLIKWSDAILVLNYEKKGISGYIGGSTLIEIGNAICFDKPVYLLKPVPKISYREEILAAEPIILNGDLSKIEGTVRVK